MIDSKLLPSKFETHNVTCIGFHKRQQTAEDIRPLAPVVADIYRPGCCICTVSPRA